MGSGFLVGLPGGAAGRASSAYRAGGALPDRLAGHTSFLVAAVAIAALAAGLAAALVRGARDE